MAQALRVGGPPPGPTPAHSTPVAGGAPLLHPHASERRRAFHDHGRTAAWVGKA